MKQETPKIINPADIRTMHKDLKKPKEFKTPMVTGAPKPVSPPVKLEIKPPVQSAPPRPPVQQKPAMPQPQPKPVTPSATPKPSAPPPLQKLPQPPQAPRPQQPVIAQKMSLPTAISPSLKSALDKKISATPLPPPPPPLPQPKPIEPTPAQPPVMQKSAGHTKTFMEEVEELAHQTNQ